ncbi:phosphoribosylanthranilate isomerase [Laceyella putida]|jgi:phosphoribosylanthranilate isomerase|uniref:N-(5'-phosphoribosyl)anthranilate isomerase n=1 Tax=Laceyella putida TaxID=110101 RepID=A0ABW2RM16_9BACL
MTRIKLCGFRTVEDVRKASSLPIDAMGFILVPGRKRTIPLDRLAEMLSAVPPGIKKVAVLKDASVSEITELQSRFSFDGLQLHGEESPAYCRALRERVPIDLCKVFHVSQTAVLKAEVPLYAPWIDRILLDSAMGGTGETFDWTEIPRWKDAAQAFQIPLWVAGGLHPDNVANLIKPYGPDGVDVSSGIETDGSKDEEKMKRFVERVRECDDERSGGGTAGLMEIR